MIVVRVKGGLGNQMFQYAAGLRLAHVRQVELKLDLSYYKRPPEGSTPRKFELDRLNISAPVAIPEEIGCFTRDPAGGRRWRRLVLRLLGASGRPWIREDTPRFDPRVLRAPRDAYLDGYWQSERYFGDVVDRVRSEFTFRDPLEGKSREIADRIGSCESVSLHVRRADYISHSRAAARHGTCPLEYYRRAVAEINRRVGHPEFYVFSDDAKWAREYIQTEFPSTFVDHNDPEYGFDDMHLMSLCRHHVIANSSFSWWGAWLSRPLNRIVIGPRRWFADSESASADLLPTDWLRL